MSEAILLLAHGTPETLDEIPQYLRNVTSGRPLPQHVVEEITRRHELIGKSPLTDLTFAQARALEAACGVRVYVGMRNWKPYVADTVRAMREDGVTRAVAICLAPQNSRTSVGLYKRAAHAEAGDALKLDFVDEWAAHPLLVRAFAEKLLPAWRSAREAAGAQVPIVFTAHSVPCRTLWSTTAIPLDDTAPPTNATPQAPDTYAGDAKRTAALVADALAASGLREQDWVFAFQSQGASGGPWIGPSVEDTLACLQKEGHANAVIAPIGFLCDHVEILYDIDIGFRDWGREHGIAVSRPESLNDSPLLIGALKGLAEQGLARLRCA